MAMRSTDHGIQKVCILGAGMMGAGLAWLNASKGLDVVVGRHPTGGADEVEPIVWLRQLAKTPKQG